MNKVHELSKTQKNEEKLLIAKVSDKIKFANIKNNIQHTSFLDLAQQMLIKQTLEIRKIDNYELCGGYEQAERKILIILPQQHIENINNIKNYKKTIINDLMSIIRIELPKEQHNQYEHRTYLGSIMKLGVKREKIGDIIVRSDGADIIISRDIENYLENDIKHLTRFQKSIVKIHSIDDLNYTEQKKEIMKINVSSMRLDCIVAELARCSRKEANRLIEQERVFVNFKEEIAFNKKIDENTYITIRGKGRFKILDIKGQTRSGRFIVEVFC